MNEGAVRLDGFGAAGLVPTCKGEARLPSFTIWITSRSLGDRYEASCVAITAGSIYLSILPFIFLSISPFIHRSIYLSLCLCPSPSLSLYARRFLYIDRHACMHTYAAYMYACMHGCMCVCMYVLVYVCVYIYMYIQVYAHPRMYMHILHAHAYVNVATGQSGSWIRHRRRPSRQRRPSAARFVLLSLFLALI